MLALLALLLPARIPPMLACTHSNHKHLIVTQAQWQYIHGELDSWDIERVNALVHPTRGVKVRSVQTAFPEFHGGRIAADYGRWYRKDFAERLEHADMTIPHPYDPVSPGYWFGSISSLSVDSGSIAKGDVLYNPLSGEAEPGSLAPYCFIRMVCREGRLWLDEGSSATVTE